MKPYTNSQLVQRLTLIRHGESSFNVAREKAKSEGNVKYFRPMDIKDADVPLTDRGKEQARLTGKMAFQHSVSAIITSPYTRAYDTASLIIEEYNKVVLPHRSLGNAHLFIDERLREKEYGIWNYYTEDEMATYQPHEIIRKNKEGRYYYRPNGGESIPDLRLRTRQLLDDINREFRYLSVVLVTHGLTILAIRSLIENWTPEEFVMRDAKNDVLNCSVLVYEGLGDEFYLRGDQRIYY